MHKETTGSTVLTKDDFIQFMDYAKEQRREDIKEMKTFFDLIVVQKLEEFKMKQTALTNNLVKRVAELEAKILHSHGQDTPPMHGENITVVRNDEEKKKNIQQARKTIGLSTVNMKDLDRIRRTRNITDEEELKTALDREFFKLLMRMKEEDMDALNISKVFYAVNNPSWKNLYIEFSDEVSVSTCYRFANNLKPGRRIFQYIPKMFYNRYKALDRHAYNLRHSSHHYKTRIRFGNDDIVLMKSLPGQNLWTYSKHEDLPLVEQPTTLTRTTISSNHSSGPDSTDRLANRTSF